MESVAILAGIRASDFALVAVGFALVFGSCRVLNLMHGAYVMLGAYGTYAFLHLLIGAGPASPRIVVLAVLLSAGSTALLAFLFFRLLQLTKRTEPEHVLATSMAGNLFIASVVAYYYGTHGINVPPILPGAATIGSVSLPASQLLIPGAAAVSLTALWAWLYRTRSGTALRAVADNAVAARLAGVEPARALAGAVAIAAFLAGLAGALRAPSQTLTPDMWVHPLLISFAVVVFGGRNNLIGAIVSACLLGIIETLTSWYWNEAASWFVALLVIVIGLLWLPTGLLGSPRYESR